MSPYVKTDLVNERSCYALLLLHKPWTVDGEEGLLGGFERSTEALAAAISNGELPDYAQPAMKRLAKSERLLDDDGYGSVGSLSDDDYFTDDSDDEHGGDRRMKHVDFEVPFDEDEESGSQATPTSIGSKDENVVERGITGISARREKVDLAKYISDKQTQYIAEYTKLNKIPDSKGGSDTINPYYCEDFVPYANHEKMKTEFEKGYASCCDKQKKAIDILRLSHERDLEVDKQLLMFISGEGGTGKSYVIHLMRLLTKIRFGRTEGLYGPFLPLAPTGGSANGIAGFTYHSVLHMGFGGNSRPETIRMMGINLKGVRVIIFDEMSMISAESLDGINRTLREIRRAMEGTNELLSALNLLLSDQPFGGWDIVFGGDFWQLPPVEGTSLYSTTFKETNYRGIRGRKLWLLVYRFVELLKNHRCKEGNIGFAKFLSRSRVGDVDLEYLAQLNERCVKTDISSVRESSHPHALWLAPTNKIVDEMNAMVIEELIRDENNTPYRAVAIHTPSSSSLAVLNDRTSKYLHSKEAKQGMQASDITFVTSQRVMVKTNTGTQIGIYNGAMGTVVSFGFNGVARNISMCPRNRASRCYRKEREHPIIYVQMDHIAKIGGVEISCSDNIDRLIPFAMQDSIASTTVGGTYWHRKQYQIAPANAITVHRAQGCTAKCGAVIKLRYLNGLF